jgi:2-methylaconitate cis-trans-isomerase PrpF
VKKKMLDNIYFTVYYNYEFTLQRKTAKGGNKMLKNLQAAMNTKNISAKALAQVMGSTEKTARNKLDGITEFTFSEVVAISENLFPEYDLRYLFTQSNEKKAG